MSLIIPGVELPPIDEYLHLRIDGNGYVSMQISENQYIRDLYDTDKKAIELPPHGRLIDADKIETERHGNNSQRIMWSNIRQLLSEAETIIPAEEE